MENLFAYGTLMCDDIMQLVTGKSFQSKNGVAEGFVRLKVKGGEYPGMIERTSSQVEGLVYFDVDGKSWELLDKFEGNMYDRVSVSLLLDDGTLIKCFTYLVKKEYQMQLEESRWSFQEFLQAGKKSFLQGYKGFSVQ